MVYASRALFTPKGCHLSILLILILYGFFLVTDNFFAVKMRTGVSEADFSVNSGPLQGIAVDTAPALLPLPPPHPCHCSPRFIKYLHLQVQYESRYSVSLGTDCSGVYLCTQVPLYITLGRRPRSDLGLGSNPAFLEPSCFSDTAS